MTTPNDDACVTLAQLRAAFMGTLGADYPVRRALDALLVPGPSFKQAAPHFDGFALRNAQGKSFDDLVDLEALWSAPALAALSKPERRALLARKFEEMSESTKFSIARIGSD